MNKQSAIDKIVKLRKLANNNSNKNEAHSASAMASKLMEKYSIAENDIMDTVTFNKETKVHYSYTKPKKKKPTNYPYSDRNDRHNTVYVKFIYDEMSDFYLSFDDFKKFLTYIFPFMDVHDESLSVIVGLKNFEYACKISGISNVNEFITYALKKYNEKGTSPFDTFFNIRRKFMRQSFNPYSKHYKKYILYNNGKVEDYGNASVYGFITFICYTMIIPLLVMSLVGIIFS